MLRYRLVMSVSHDNEPPQCYHCNAKAWPGNPGRSDWQRENHERDYPDHSDDARMAVEYLFHCIIVRYPGLPVSVAVAAPSPAWALRSRKAQAGDIRNAIGAIKKLMTTSPHIASQ
jgi:hypothetical protein